MIINKISLLTKSPVGDGTLSAQLLFDQSGNFTLIGESLSFDIFLGVDQLAVTFYIEDTAAAFDQLNI
jgi:hypothetical protein